MRKLILAVFVLVFTSAAIAQCPYPQGELLGWGNANFVVKYCRAFPMEGEQEIRFLGYRWTDRRPVNMAVFPLSQFSRGDGATLPWTYPDGTLVQALDSPVFLISNGRKSFVPDREGFANCGFATSAVMRIPRMELEHIPDGEPFLARACEGVHWIQAHAGATVPPGAIETGRDTQGPARGMSNYLCRAAHGNGMHPGKFVNGKCNIAYGSQNIIKDDFEFAVGRGEWARGSIAGALAGGYEDGQLLYVCRARLTSSVMAQNANPPATAQMQPRNYGYGDYGVHGGKLLPNGRCYITYGDADYWTTDYELFYERYERGYRGWDHDRDRDRDRDKDRPR